MFFVQRRFVYSAIAAIDGVKRTYAELTHIGNQAKAFVALKHWGIINLSYAKKRENARIHLMRRTKKARQRLALIDETQRFLNLYAKRMVEDLRILYEHSLIKGNRPSDDDDVDGAFDPTKFTIVDGRLQRKEIKLYKQADYGNFFRLTEMRRIAMTELAVFAERGMAHTRRQHGIVEFLSALGKRIVKNATQLAEARAWLLSAGEKYFYYCSVIRDRALEILVYRAERCKEVVQVKDEAQAYLTAYALRMQPWVLVREATLASLIKHAQNLIIREG